MTSLNHNDLLNVQGGDFIGGACLAFTATSTVFYLGAAANLWNPGGWGALIATAVVDTACVAYGLSAP
jgi:hypothetical protein